MSCSDTAPVIEVLYPEFGNQAGDNGNEMYLRACLPDATFVHTSYGDTPYLADKVPSLVLMCGMTELAAGYRGTGACAIPRSSRRAHR